MDVAAGLQSFKIVFDSLNALSKIRSDTDRTLAIADIVGQLGEARSAFMASQERELALAEEKRALETECLRLKEWSVVERQRYALKEHGSNGVLAYALKDPEGAGEPAHSLCPDCFSNTKKSILQTERTDAGRAEALVCHTCGWHAYTHGHAPMPTPARTRGR